MNDSSQDPVYIEEPIIVIVESRCILDSNNSDGEKKTVKTESPESISLESLSVEDVCYLLDHSQLGAITAVARENQFSGTVLVTGVESAEDLKEFGIKSMFAQSLFKHIMKWKASGVSADIFARRDATVSPAALSRTGEIGAGIHSRADNALSQGRKGSADSLLPTPPNLLPHSIVSPPNGSQHKPRKTMFKIVTGENKQRNVGRRQAREKEIRDLTVALNALQTDMHRDSARVVGSRDESGSIRAAVKCCICESVETRHKQINVGQLNCKHNRELIIKVVESCSTCYEIVLELGSSRLKELMG